MDKKYIAYEKLIYSIRIISYSIYVFLEPARFFIRDIDNTQRISVWRRNRFGYPTRSCRRFGISVVFEKEVKNTGTCRPVSIKLFPPFSFELF